MKKSLKRIFFLGLIAIIGISSLLCSFAGCAKDKNDDVITDEHGHVHDHEHDHEHSHSIFPNENELVLPKVLPTYDGEGNDVISDNHKATTVILRAVKSEHGYTYCTEGASKYANYVVIGNFENAHFHEGSFVLCNAEVYLVEADTNTYGGDFPAFFVIIAKDAKNATEMTKGQAENLINSIPKI